MVQRSSNTHQDKMKGLPFVARLVREEPLRATDDRELREAAGRLAGPTGWYSHQGGRGEWEVKYFRFGTPAEAEAMQRWIDESGIEKRPAPPKYEGPTLSVGGYGKG
jgi:hypothetical protein